jgi:hypothetical protein
MKYLSDKTMVELFPEYRDYIMKAEYKTACGCVNCIIMMVERDHGVNLWERMPDEYKTIFEVDI